MKKLFVGLLLALLALPALAQNTVRTGTLFASAVRTATVTGSDMSNDAYKCLVVAFDITVVPGGDTVTVTVQGKDVTSGKYYTLLAGAAEAGTATRTYSICPGLPATANVSANAIVPQTWRVIVTHSAGTSFTYSIGYSIGF